MKLAATAAKVEAESELVNKLGTAKPYEHQSSASAEWAYGEGDAKPFPQIEEEKEADA